MAERLKDKFLENKIVDLVAGPDSYRDLPRLIKILENKEGE
jgi:tRNA-2-methylthio-N6-dimethylallyladenosine synthase